MESNTKKSTLHKGQWVKLNEVYYLQLFDDPNKNQFQAAIQEVVAAVESSGTACQLFLDVSEMRFTSNTWMNILTVHAELHNLPLDQVTIVGQSKNRLMRLMMTKLFESTTAQLQFADQFTDTVGMGSG